MYYEDENNLYHYSYRKGDKTDDVRDVRSSEAPRSEPWEAPQPAKKKRGALKLCALALVCALLGGAAGAGVATHLSSADEKGEVAELNVSARPAAEVKTVKVDGKQKMSFAEIYKANINSVVSINTTTTTNVFGQTTESAASGSGFFITSNGYIVTNYHVINGASAVKVTTYDGADYDAAIIGGDEDYDIAVIKVEGESFAPVVLGDSSTLSIGEDVCAIGNPLGELTFSMSEGIVSCTDRAINVDGTPFNMIQVTCAINPGNSGGPLFNAYGEVIGIVSAKYSTYSSTTVEGLGFAIPMHDVTAMITDIMTNGYVTNKPYLGASIGTLTSSMAQQYHYSISQGAFVYSVEEDSAAAKAGLKMGDVIVKLNDKTISSLDDLLAAKKSYSAGDTVTLTIYREGAEQTVSLTFDATPQQTQEDNSSNGQSGNGNNGSNGYGGYGYFDPRDFFNYFFGGGYR